VSLNRALLSGPRRAVSVSITLLSPCSYLPTTYPPHHPAAPTGNSVASLAPAWPQCNLPGTPAVRQSEAPSEAPPPASSYGLLLRLTVSSYGLRSPPTGPYSPLTGFSSLLLLRAPPTDTNISASKRRAPLPGTRFHSLPMLSRIAPL
jgi:hypothetical protein